MLWEDKFEWGNPRNGFLDELSEEESKLAAAAFKWRVEVQSGRSNGALEGIRAIVHSNHQSFCRLVNLGGGMVVKADPPYVDPKDATHCIYEGGLNVRVDMKVRIP